MHTRLITVDEFHRMWHAGIFRDEAPRPVVPA